MSLKAAASGLVVFLLSVQGTVHLHLYCKSVNAPQSEKQSVCLCG